MTTKEDLFNASKTGNDLQVLKCLQEGVPIDSIDTSNKNFTALFYAIKFSNPVVVKCLIDNGASTEMKDSDDCMPIHYAACFGDTDYDLNYLLDNSYDYMVNVQDGAGWTPLHYAASFMQHGKVKTLLERKANPCLKNVENDIPMELSLSKGDQDSYLLLNEWNKLKLFKHIQVICAEDPRKKNTTEETDIPNFKIQNIVDCYQLSDFYDAARVGDLYKLKSYLEESKAIIKCDSHDSRENMSTALMYASGNGHLDVVQYLVENQKANVSLKDNYDNLAIHYASFFGHELIVEYLLKQEVSHIDDQNCVQFTPLHCSCYNENSNVLKLLLKHNACHDITNNQNFTPMQQATHLGESKFANLLKYHSIIGLVEQLKLSDYDSEHCCLHREVMCGDWINIISVLNSYPARLHEVDSEGRTPTDLAALMGQKDVVTMLRARGGHYQLYGIELMDSICDRREPYKFLMREYLEFDEILSDHMDGDIVL